MGGWANWSGFAKGAVIGAGIGAIGGAAYALSTDKKGWGWYALGGGVAGGLAGGGIGELLDNTVKPGNTRFRTTRDHMYKKFKGNGWGPPRKGIPKPPNLDRYIPAIGQTITRAKELLEPPERREVPDPFEGSRTDRKKLRYPTITWTHKTNNLDELLQNVMVDQMKLLTIIMKQ